MPSSSLRDRAIRVVIYLRIVQAISPKTVDGQYRVYAQEVRRLWPAEKPANLSRFFRKFGIKDFCILGEAIQRVLSYLDAQDIPDPPNIDQLRQALSAWRSYRAALQASKIGVRNACATVKGEILTLRDECEFRRSLEDKRRCVSRR